MAVATSGQPHIDAAAAGVPTVASLARDWARRTPHHVAMREKDFGIWREYSWDTTWNLVLDAAHGLLALGVDTGDRVSIHSEDRPEWVLVDLATVAVRGITVGLYPTNPAAEVEYLLTDSGASVHLAEDQEQVDKALAMDGGPRTIIYLEPRGMHEYEDDRLLSWEEFLERGRTHRAEHPGEVERRMDQAQSDDVMTLVYTSGTTGPPKGAMLTNANAAFSMDVIVNLGQRLPGGKPPNQDDLIVTYLPLCHVAERIFSTWHLVRCGAVLNFAESIDTIAVNLNEVQPTLFFAVPRIWEKLHATVLIRGQDATWFKRKVLGVSLAMARKIGKARVANGGNHTIGSRLLYAVAFVLALRALKTRIGLRRCRYAASGAAPIAPEVLEFFLGLGVPVFELYGMTENSAVATANFPGRMKLGTVGEPYPGIGLRLDPETGEIQTKHAGTFAGYWGKPDKTAETMTDDGWLRTGDVGEWVDGDTHQDRRPHQAHHHHVGRQERLAVGDREQLEDVAVRERGDGRRRRPQVPRCPRRHRVRDGRRLGPAPQPAVHDVPRSQREARGRRVDPGGRHQDERALRLGRAGQAVPPVAQGARPRGRRADGDAEAEAGGDARHVR